MRIKTLPEDFRVEEIGLPADAGPYVLLQLTKRDMTTEDAVAVIATSLHIPRKFIGYAGTKDRRAITTQYVTMKAPKKKIERFKHPNISLNIVGSRDEPLGLGMLEGNTFTIVVRELKDETIHEIKQIPNYFDEQRFSKHNAELGKYILQGKFKGAVALLQEDGHYKEKIATHLQTHKNDWIGALKIVPKHTLLLFVHAFQSELFNEVLRRFIRQHEAIGIEGPVPLTIPKNELENVSVPIIGFDTELKHPWNQWYEELLERHGVTQRDFVVKSLPFLTVEGTTREAFVEIEDLEIEKREGDEQTLSFALPKGAYATIVVKCLYRVGRFEKS